MTQLFGKYRGTVKSVDDPQKRGRVLIDCPQALAGKLLNWALPNFVPNVYMMPRVNDMIWVEFEQGNVDAPIWTGVFYTSQQYYDKFLKEDPLYPTYDPDVSKLFALKNTTFRFDEKFNVHSLKDTTLKSDQNLNTKSAAQTTLKAGTVFVAKGGNTAELYGELVNLSSESPLCFYIPNGTVSESSLAPDFEPPEAEG